MQNNELDGRVSALIAEAERTLAESHTLVAEVLALFDGRPPEPGVHLLDPLFPFRHT